MPVTSLKSLLLLWNPNSSCFGWLLPSERGLLRRLRHIVKAALGAMSLPRWGFPSRPLNLQLVRLHSLLIIHERSSQYESLCQSHNTPNSHVSYQLVVHPTDGCGRTHASSCARIISDYRSESTIDHCVTSGNLIPGLWILIVFCEFDSRQFKSITGLLLSVSITDRKLSVWVDYEQEAQTRNKWVIGKHGSTVIHWCTGSDLSKLSKQIWMHQNILTIPNYLTSH